MTEIACGHSVQRIYVALDEPDGVAGLSALRKGDASVKEKILEQESSGQFSDAASYYNLAIKKEPKELAHYEVGEGEGLSGVERVYERRWECG